MAVAQSSTNRSRDKLRSWRGWVRLGWRSLSETNRNADYFSKSSSCGRRL